MRTNPVKDRLLRGGHVVGTMALEFFTPGLPRILSAAGADFVIYDAEHGGIGIETLKAQLAYAAASAVVPIVRVPGLDYAAIAAALDCGALGIVVPMVESPEQARDLVACTRYPPQGRRDAAFGMAHDEFSDGPVAAKLEAANARTLVMAIIEKEAGLEAVEEIAAVPGIDVLWLGQFDLTNSLGIPGDFDHIRYTSAVERIAAAGRAHGRVCGMMVPDEAWAATHGRLGFRMLAYGLDHHLFRAALAAGLRRVRRLLK